MVVHVRYIQTDVPCVLVSTTLGISLALGLCDSFTEVIISIDKALNFELGLLEIKNITVFLSVTIGRILVNCSYELLLSSELSEINSLITDPFTTGVQQC